MARIIKYLRVRRIYDDASMIINIASDEHNVLCMPMLMRDIVSFIEGPRSSIVITISKINGNDPIVDYVIVFNSNDIMTSIDWVYHSYCFGKICVTNDSYMEFKLQDVYGRPMIEHYSYVWPVEDINELIRDVAAARY